MDRLPSCDGAAAKLFSQLARKYMVHDEENSEPELQLGRKTNADSGEEGDSSEADGVDGQRKQPDEVQVETPPPQ